MTTSTEYYRAEKLYASRRSGRDYKRISRNQVLLYDEQRDCYMHKHHRTITVWIHRDKFVISTGGWDTKTTWKKINEWSPIRAWAKRTSSWVGSKYVYWGPGSWRNQCATEYYDGIEVDADGVPLDPKPIKVRRLRKGVTAPYIELRNRVFKVLGPRAAIGEFDQIEAKPVNGMQLLHLVTDVAEWMRDHPAQVFVPDELNWRALFAHRPQMAFGRPLRSSYYARELPTSLQWLRSNLAAAGKVWLDQQDDAYEVIEKPYDYRSKP